MKGWVSPRLGIKFELTTETLEIFRPDGDKFLTFVELGKLREIETKRADDEQQRANELQEQLQQEQEQRKRLENKLRELGIDLNDV